MHLTKVVLLLIGSVPIALSLPPLHSTVQYQTRQNSNKLELEETSREEVTEKSLHSPTPGELLELTTEKDSEQINFARFVHAKQADKLRLECGGTTTEYENSGTTTEVPAENFEDPSALIGNIENFDTSIEADDLNEQGNEYSNALLSDFDSSFPGFYYVIHPSGLFQKVVFKTIGELSEDVRPIVESFRTYDPQTFVLQRVTLKLPAYV
ncbi:uncharacterized protein LOC126747870 isoform X1 [Anthonomus grandis grandis]|uniref:uncharacterized protein LOC126747870 isoform X1 n=1 Tax=Anthonomus grandis grandis TaxID=2921223 RepID=UPI002165D180|nr:uncharacterized protein LOC126747870 isoform X1 [Anthonomus grandis grandis]